VARGWLGVSTEAPPSRQRGALIAAVQRSGPAARAGLMPGDIITRLGDHAVEQPDDLVSATLETEAGARIEVEVVREGRPRTVTVELGTRPALRRTAPGR
jgi:S1-C subfamily serine protease